MAMRFVLQIGMHKTGSTALQQALFDARAALLRGGVLYPDVSPRAQALTTLGLLGRARDVPLTLTDLEPHNALVSRLISEANPQIPFPHFYDDTPRGELMLDAVRAQIDVFEPREVLLVSEVLSAMPHRAPASLARLAAWMGEAPARVMCTVRRLDDMLASWIAQQVRFRRAPPRLDVPGELPFFDRPFVEADVLLEAWAAALPHADIVVRSYDEVRRSGGAVADFVAQSGVPGLGAHLTERAANPSVPHALLPLARAMMSRPRRRNKLDDLADHLTAAAARIGAPPNREVELFGPENRRLLHARMLQIDERVRALTGRGPLFEDPDDVLRPRPREVEAEARRLLPALKADAEATLGPGPLRKTIRALTLD